MSTLSGFCGITNPEDSHGRCVKDDCPCICHRLTTAAPPAYTDPVAAVTAAVADLEAGLDGLVDACTDPQALDVAQLLYDVQAARLKLHDMEREVEGRLAKALMGDQVDGNGLRVERRRSRDRKEWDHDAWRRDVRAKVVQSCGLKGAQGVVTAGGEVLPADVLWRALQTVQDVEASKPPRLTQLRGLGLDPEDYCSTSPGVVHVAVQRLADDYCSGAEPLPAEVPGGETGDAA